MAVQTNFAKTIADAATAGAQPLGELVSLLLADASPPDFTGLDSKGILDLAQGRLDHLSERRLGLAKIAVAATPSGATIDIVNDDMPFLVDSALTLFNELGLEIVRFVHPVIAVKRASGGTLADLDAKTTAAPGFVRESVMFVETRPLPMGLTAEALQEALRNALADVRLAVIDWRAMQQRLKDAIAAWQANPPPLPIEELTESIAFLQWLADNHFTFLGARDYAFDGGDLKPMEGTGLGILRKAERDPLMRGGEQMAVTPEIREFLMQPVGIIISKSGMKSQVHRRVALDYVGVKLFGETGELTGELRLTGLFTSSAYTQNPNDVPLLRRKLKAIVAASGYDPGSHSGKALANALETYPRDELFQIETETLGGIAHGILKLEERPRTRLFVRRDRFDRFVSAFVFIPRDRFNSDVRIRTGALLAQAFAGEIASFAPFFGEGALVRVHFIVERHAGPDPDPDLEALEARIVDVVRSWDDRLAEAMPRPLADRALAAWRQAFPAGYRDENGLDRAIGDIGEFERLRAEGGVGVRFARRAGDRDSGCHARLYRLGPAIPLSDRLPIFERLGFHSISETTWELTPAGGGAVIHEVALERAAGGAVETSGFARLEDAFLAVWNGQAENDGFNALIALEALDWRDAALLRAFARYLRQASATYTPDYMAQTLARHSAIAAKLVAAFRAGFDPGKRDDAGAKALKDEIETAAGGIASLDEDRIIRRMLNLIDSILRTNAYQRDADGAHRPAISFKIDSKRIDGLPDPRPFAEIFVYAPDVEGVHLRGGPVARGGLRWSDRPEDFRTEVLGLAKAQGVKNAVIVPAGAKGGFVPKKLPPGGSREAVQAEGIRAYKLFVGSLLELTDNIVGNGIAPPEATVRRDGDDPYLVVAADKGTAAFSDIANGLSRDRGFWLDDAFASGGSAGYDHKKMAITARGGWEAVKRHFREMGTDIQVEPFTVIGVGDMSGDVFGNGMLLSRHIRLVAAFDHRDIFLNPDPDAARSFAERQRLFGLARSSWQDYDKTLVSKGGGVFSRTLKAIPLSAETRALTGLGGETATVQELLHALLKAPCDLLWFGGIGTYVKSATETHGDAGDRANDAIRVDAPELQAKVIGEGANLGVTQKGRVAFALKGGRINTDAVDNSAGVNSSDVEVNIKIALGAAEAKGKLTREARNTLLASMTGDVAALVLRNNYLQTLCLSLAAAQGTEENGYATELMHALEARGYLDRKLESLPTDAEIVERDARGQTLTRPEFAVVMAFAKLALNDDLVGSGVPDDPYFAASLARYFPPAMQRGYADEIAGHRLRREIVATMLSNSMINRGGPSFVTRLQGETGRSVAEIAAAFAVARDSFGFTGLNGLVDGLDGKVPGAVQMELYFDLQRFQRWSTVWFLRHEPLDKGIDAAVRRYGEGLATVAANFDTLLPESGRDGLEMRAAELVAAGVPADGARRLAIQRPLQRAPDAVRIAGQSKARLETVARAVFVSSDALGVERLAGEAGRLVARDFIERRAINRLTGQLFQTHRAIVLRIVTEARDWESWQAKNAAALRRATEQIEAIASDKSFDLARLAVAQGALADLAAA